LEVGTVGKMLKARTLTGAFNGTHVFVSFFTI